MAVPRKFNASVKLYKFFSIGLKTLAHGKKVVELVL